MKVLHTFTDVCSRVQLFAINWVSLSVDVMLLTYHELQPAASVVDSGYRDPPIIAIYIVPTVMYASG